MSNAYIFYGKAGSGKGTQAKLLQDFLESQGRKVIYIETGELFRQFVANNNSFTAKRTAEIIDDGQLMPAFFPIYTWADELVKNYTGTEDIILDGVARRIEESQILDRALDFFKIEKKVVFQVDISDETAITRLQSRGQDRADDQDVEKIQKRLDWYLTNVGPVLEYFSNNENCQFVKIDGEPDVDVVFTQIKNSLA